MDFFEESNFILFKILGKSQDIYGECLFGMGCNFFGLRDIEKAKECFRNYLLAYPAGEFEPDVRDFLEMIEYDAYEDENIPGEVLARADEGKTLLDNSEYDKAISVLSEIGAKYPDMQFVKNNLALAYYCKGNSTRATEISKEVLDADPANAHAICNLILFAMSSSDEAELARYRAMLDKTEGKDADEDLKIALTYCELGEDEKAYQILKSVLIEIPYDIHTLFFAAASAANTARYAESMQYFLDMIKLQPENTVALYYKKLVQKAMDGKINARIQYNYQVPQDEIHRRMHYLNRCFQKNIDELTEMWRHEENFRFMLLWGLSIGNAIVKHAIVDLISKFNDETAVDLFKDFILRRNKPDEEKNDIFLALKRMGAPQPYVAYVAGKISEVRIGMVDLNKQKFAPSNDKVVDEVIRDAEIIGQKLYITQAIELLGKYVHAFNKPPIMRNVEAWAAAFLFAALENENEPFTGEELIRRLGLRTASFVRCLRAIRSVLKE